MQVDSEKQDQISLEYDDLQPGVSQDEIAGGAQRTKQVVVGVFLVIAGIALMPLPGPGWVVTLYGLNLIKPDNALVRFIRRRIPGIPEDGSVPRRYIYIGAVLMIAGTVYSILYGRKTWDWIWEFLTGLF